MHVASVDPATTGTVRSLIDRMAELRGAATFLIDPDTRHEVTYGDLRQRAYAVARDLGRQLAKGDKVAFLLENGLFGTDLFFGAMYGGFVPVPLAPAAGPSQLAYTLEHSDAKVVIVSDDHLQLLERVPRGSCRLVVVSTGESAPGADVPGSGPGGAGADPGRGPGGAGVLPGGSPHGTAGTRSQGRAKSPAALDPDDDAVLTYTSGSTGLPKGVLASHRGLLAGCMVAVDAHGLSARDRTLCVLPLCHANAQVVTLIPTLLSGGSVVLPRAFSAASFWHWIAEYGCTWFAAVPTMIAQLVHAADSVDDREREAALRSVRFARCSSAPLAPELRRAFEERFDVPLIEAMGSTEAGAMVFSNPLPPGRRKIGSVGVPHGFDARVVAPDARECAEGETGEILVRGRSVMKGYYKDPAASAECIDRDGWLHTGDEGYRDADGYFYLTGRLRESIVKGGEKIAPREIEEALERHPAVLEAAAVGVRDRFFVEDVVAYVVLKPGTASSARELTDFSLSELGPFKAPARIHLVRELPRGPSGKVQRRKLVEHAERSEDGDGRPAAIDRWTSYLDGGGRRTRIEDRLREIWGELLATDRIPAGADFFALGGSSLTAGLLVSRVRAAFGVDVPIGRVFERPTIASFAELVESLEGSRSHPGSGAIPRLCLRVAPLSPAQQRLWFLDQLNRGDPTYNEAANARLHGPLDVAALEAGVNEIVRRHDALRTIFRVVDDEPVQVVASAMPVAIPVVDLTGLSEDERERRARLLASTEVGKPFDLERGPLLRATVVRLRPQEHLLLLTVHHIVSDAWSLRVFYRELGWLYAAASSGGPAGQEVAGGSFPLAELPIQYSDYAVWQRGRLQGEAFDSHLAYWRTQLAGAPAVLELPTDRPRPAVQAPCGARETRLLSASLAERLQRFSRDEAVTLFMTMLAGFAVVLRDWTGRDDIVVGAPVAGRTEPETEGLIGFFVGMLVLRTDLGGRPTFREVLGRVRETALSAYAHADVPFERLVETLAPRRSRSYTPLVQVVLNMLNLEPLELELPRLEASMFLPEAAYSKFDLVLRASETRRGVEIGAVYRPDLFDANSIADLLNRYEEMLERAVSSPAITIDALFPTPGPGAPLDRLSIPLTRRG